jgi:predicted CXXCH cytochrome family protein
MTPTPTRSSLAVISAALFSTLALAGVASTPGCANSDDGGVQIVTDGGHSVEVGRTIAITAETDHGTDHAYTWSSPDEAIATVSADGVVTGVSPGEVTIEVAGDDTDAVGLHVVVVLDGDAATSGGTGDPDTGGTTGDTDAGTGGSDGGSDGGNAVPFYDEWKMSAHADASAEAFTHWDEDGEIPTSCAKCHSREGFRDYLGDDFSEVGVVNQPAAPGSVVDCETCHNNAANELDWVTFPSGVTVDELGGEARCMTCHQGRGSSDSVDDAIEAAGVGDDEVSDALHFENIHYFPVAATLFAGQVRGGYQYAEQVYDRRFRHVPEFDSCIGCHDPHTTQPKIDDCATCHPAVMEVPDVRNIRMIASRNVDYDGDGDTTVGIYYEVKGLEEKLYRAIQRYASGELGQPICYSVDAYPYWFRSASGANAECTDDEAVSDNGFDQWSPRLVRAAYNYQMARKDPGAYVHNGRYIVKLLHDSITDINTVITNPVDMSQAMRDAPGHFNGASEAARHWDEDETVSPSCSKCHSGATGYRFWIEYGVGLEVPETANGLECYTCHENFGNTYDLLDVESTTYADGTVLSHDGYDNLCATCHSGRETGAKVDATIASGNVGFRNVHYLPAAGVRNGNESGVGYEYPSMDYAGFLQHDNRTQCTGCHDPVESNHTFRISDAWATTCDVCHSDDNGPEEIRIVHLDDYDGDGNTNEFLRAELQGLADQLLVTIVGNAASPLCYSPTSYPYFLGQMGDADGYCAPGASGGFGNWTPELVRATYNFQLHAKEPGAYAHNFDYMAQLLFDSIEDMGGDVTGLVRP